MNQSIFRTFERNGCITHCFLNLFDGVDLTTDQATVVWLRLLAPKIISFM